VSRTEISGIETGRLVPSVTVALRLSQALGEPVEVLFGDRAGSAVEAWAWPQSHERDGRFWRASVRARTLLYPCEPTAAGVVPHDGVLVKKPSNATRTASLMTDRTLVLAGCDPMVGLLVHEMAAQHGIRVLPLLRSSTEALSLLKRGLVHVAGMHFTAGAHGGANDQAVLAALGHGHTLIHQVGWQAGIAVGPSRHERSTRSLLQANVRWVNREQGSAARMTFDRLLGHRQKPSGYEHVVHDHRAVAATVSSGWAEAGMCVSPAAAEAHLGFIAVQTEAYEICAPNDLISDFRVESLIATLQSLRYRQLIRDVPGCAAEQTGEMRAVA
jgi:molybdate-binding protein